MYGVTTVKDSLVLSKKGFLPKLLLNLWLKYEHRVECLD